MGLLLFENFLSVVIPFLNANISFAEKVADMNCVNELFLVSDRHTEFTHKKFKSLVAEKYFSTGMLSKLKDLVSSPYILFITSVGKMDISENALNRFIRVADDANAGFIYSDYHEIINDTVVPHPTIDYQPGSVRDDFDLGKMFIIKTSLLKSYCSYIYIDYLFAGFYDFRLFISRHENLLRIPEFLYTSEKKDSRTSGEKQFDYVNPLNRDVQIEMEKSVSDHLKKINAYLEPEFEDVKFLKNFPLIASIIMPVKNRELTISDAINSALNQKTNFPYNIIVVDNHSTDGTTEIIRKLSSTNKNLIHIIPESKNLNIGGCWNQAINHSLCGMFSIQLDSDDLYIDENTIQKIVDKFYKDNCAMVIGSYTMTDFELKEIPPGIITHGEWTHDNGRNNALRINGLGAPRAYYTPVIRDIQFPDTSYGEDYSAVLAISRKYAIGRIYESLYLCRRWKGNTDSDLAIEQLNKNNAYKDKIRSIEIAARKKMNKRTNG